MRPTRPPPTSKCLSAEDTNVLNVPISCGTYGSDSSLGSGTLSFTFSKQGTLRISVAGFYELNLLLVTQPSVSIKHSKKLKTLTMTRKITGFVLS